MEHKIISLFDENFDFAFKAATYNNMKVAIKSFEQFKKQNSSFFSFDKRETLFGHLRTYAIEKQFNDSAFNPKSNYTVSMKQVNNFKYKALCIETADFIINVGSTSSANKLLTPSSYRKEYAKANTGLSLQETFDFTDGILEVVDGKKYAEIIYGYRNGDITHLKIVLPDSDYKGIEYSADLLEDIKVYENYVPKELVEDSIVSLKKSISDEMNNTIGNRGLANGE